MNAHEQKLLDDIEDARDRLNAHKKLLKMLKSVAAGSLTGSIAGAFVSPVLQWNGWVTVGTIIGVLVFLGFTIWASLVQYRDQYRLIEGRYSYDTKWVRQPTYAKLLKNAERAYRDYLNEQA